MIDLVFFNWLNTKVRMIVHQMEIIKVMILNRRFGSHQSTGARGNLKAV